MTNSRGEILVLEGVNGVGKTTLAAALHDRLRASGRDCVLLSFPGREPETLGAHVYELYHRPEEFKVHGATRDAIQILVTAAHVDVILSRVLPAIEEGRWVVMDRYWWSTWVYGRHEGVDPAFIDMLIDLELVQWAGTEPRAVFLVTRAEPSAALPELQDLYDALAERERTKIPIHRLANDRSIEEAADTALRAAGLF